MKLSAPIYRLKRRAKLDARAGNMPLHQALDKVAIGEGFESWSALAAQYPAIASAEAVYGKLIPGDLVLSAARPGQGKTLLALQLAIAAMNAGNSAFFFSLEYTDLDMLDRFKALGKNAANFNDRFTFDDSDQISASYITTKLADAPRGTFVVIDYLQLLDQRRENPPLENQVRALRAHARKCGHVLVFIAQIDRFYNAEKKPFPTSGDLRLPNPLDLTLFDKACFLNAGSVRLEPAS